MPTSTACYSGNPLNGIFWRLRTGAS